MPVARAAQSSHEESITAVVGDGWSSAQAIELTTKRKPSPCVYPMMRLTPPPAPRQSKAVSEYRQILFFTQYSPVEVRTVCVS